MQTWVEAMTSQSRAICYPAWLKGMLTDKKYHSHICDILMLSYFSIAAKTSTRAVH
jgi:hypothetical protein